MSAMTRQRRCLLDVSDGIATVTLNRPEVRNALSSEVLRLLPELMRTAEADDDVSVIVLTGADPAFCAGLDLERARLDGDQLGLRRRVRRARRHAAAPAARFRA